MSNDYVRELEAMLVVLLKKIEKLEGKTRLAPNSTYLKELRSQAQQLLKYWD